MAETADVVICGAGIAGLAAAYHLTLAGVRNVVLIEQGEPLSLTSDKSTECYRNFWPGPGDGMVRLMNRSLDLLEGLALDSGDAFHLNRRGYLYCTADRDRLQQLLRAAEEFERPRCRPSPRPPGTRRGVLRLRPASSDRRVRRPGRAIAPARPLSLPLGRRPRRAARAPRRLVFRAAARTVAARPGPGGRRTMAARAGAGGGDRRRPRRSRARSHSVGLDAHRHTGFRQRRRPFRRARGATARARSPGRLRAARQGVDLRCPGRHAAPGAAAHPQRSADARLVDGGASRAARGGSRSAVGGAAVRGTRPPGGPGRQPDPRGALAVPHAARRAGVPLAVRESVSGSRAARAGQAAAWSAGRISIGCPGRSSTAGITRAPARTGR